MTQEEIKAKIMALFTEIVILKEDGTDKEFTEKLIEIDRLITQWMWHV